MLYEIIKWTHEFKDKVRRVNKLLLGSFFVSSSVIVSSLLKVAGNI